MILSHIVRRERERKEPRGPEHTLPSSDGKIDEVAINFLPQNSSIRSAGDPSSFGHSALRRCVRGCARRPSRSPRVMTIQVKCPI